MCYCSQGTTNVSNKKLVIGEFANFREQLPGILKALAVGIPAGYLFDLLDTPNSVDDWANDRCCSGELDERADALAPICPSVGSGNSRFSSVALPLRHLSSPRWRVTCPRSLPRP